MSPAGTRIVGLDLARGLAFLGMVIVNYRVTLGFGARQPTWLADFVGNFTGRAAPLFVMLAGIGVTLLFTGRRRTREPRYQQAVRALRSRSPETGPGPRRGRGDHLRTAGTLVFCAAAALVVGYHVHGHYQDAETLSLADGLNAWIAGSDRLFVEVPERVSGYVDAVKAGDLNELFSWCGGGLGVVLLAWLVLGNRDPRWTLLRRALFVLALGYVWYPWWTGDILHWYGVFILVGAFLVGARWWLVWPALLATLAVRPWLRSVNGWPDWAGWTFTLDYDPFWEPLGQVRHLLYNGWHPVFPWLGFLLVGLLVGRLSLTRARTGVALLIAGVALWQGAGHGAPEVRDALSAASWAAARDAFPVETLDVPDGWTLVVGPRAAEEDEDEDELGMARRRGPRVKGRVADGVDRRDHRAAVSAARSLSRVLSRTPRRPPFTSWTLAVEPASPDGVTVFLDVGYGEDGAAPEDHEQDRDRAVHAVALALQPLHPDDAFGRVMRDGLRDRPDALGAVVVRRRLTFENAAGERRAFPVDTVRVTVADAQGLSPVLHRLSRQCRTSSMPPGPLYAVSATGTSLIVIGLCLLVAGAGIARKVLHPVICAGRMALTLYLAHVALGLTVIQALGYGDLNGELPAIVTCVVVCQVLSMAFAAWWLSLFRRGPVEAFMRWLTG